MPGEVYKSINESVRKRKFEIEEVLSNLKNLITTAKCRFIFIAGRDMMDANLADQSEGNHLYSSLFDKVIYIPAFVTDTSDGNGDDISSMVEQYVVRQLMPAEVALYFYIRHLCSTNQSFSWKDIDNDYNWYTIQNYSLYLQYINETGSLEQPSMASEENRERKKEVDHVILGLQDLIYYITYRSAGNPKRLTLQFEHFVKPIPDEVFAGGSLFYNLVAPTDKYPQYGIVVKEFDQYQIQMLSHVFLLFHGDTSALIRQYGDKLAVATFSILDYLFKFHSTGFSPRDLERMPDVIDINRAPSLPDLIALLLANILSPYVRKVDNGVYEYRFLDHFKKEVSYISRFVEQELAAFNFTLDESIWIKHHFRELRDEQLALFNKMPRDSLVSSETQALPESIAAIHIILGDLHGLDKEYNLALSEYRNALLALQPYIMLLFSHHTRITAPCALDKAQEVCVEKCWKDITNPYGAKPGRALLSVNTVFTYIRIQLKIGHLAETRKQFDLAEGSYRTAAEAVTKLLSYTQYHGLRLPSREILTLLVQPSLCLGFLRAKRDISPQLGASIIETAEKELVPQLLGLCREVSKNKAGETSLGTVDPSQRLENATFIHSYVCRPVGYPSGDWTKIRVAVRRGELYLFRSDYYKCSQIFMMAIIDFHRILLRQDDQKGDVHLLNAIGFTLSSLGDSLCARDFQRTLRNGSDSKNESAAKKMINQILSQGKGVETVVFPVRDGDLDLKKEENSIRRPCGQHSVKRLTRLLEGLMDKERTGVGVGTIAYGIAAYAYRISGRPEEAGVALWKLGFFLGYVGSYFSTLGFGEDFVENVYKENIVPFEGESSDLEGGPCILERLSTDAFGWAYRSQQERLKKLGINGEIVQWVAPPLTQTFYLMREYIKTGNESENDFDNLDLSSIGAFPINARILGHFLKGRWHLKQAFGSKVEPVLLKREGGIDGSDKLLPGEASKRHLKYAISYFSQAIEESDRYENENDIAIPDTGMAYYHLWRALWCGSSGACAIARMVIEDLGRNAIYQGERARFIQEEYVRTKAKARLRRALSRHGHDEGFFFHAESFYYLNDEFSDPYGKGLRSMEYALIPVMEGMLEDLCQIPRKHDWKVTEDAGSNLDLSRIESYHDPKSRGRNRYNLHRLCK